MDLSRPKVPVTITFSVPGTHPPVYVASSLTNPSWQPVEMDLKDERTASGDLVFEKKFDAVESGEYQYKFRLGHGDWWVCDESAPIVCDDAGNRNNLLTVKPLLSPTLERDEASSMKRPSSDPEVAAEDLHTNGMLQDAEGSTSPHDPAQGPIPITVVDKAPDADQPVHGGKDSTSLEEDSAVRTADAEPDAEYETAEATSSHAEPEMHNHVPVPAVIIEKTDGSPVHGDDLGDHATQGQKDAHEKRAADAEPDEVIITGDVEEPKELSTLHIDTLDSKPQAVPVEPAPSDDHSPLLPHEAFGDVEDEAPLLPHEKAAPVSSEGSESDEDAIASTDFETVEYDGDTPLFRHESISLPRPDSPPRSPSQTRSKSHTSLKDMMDEEDVNDPSLEPFPTRRDTIYEHIQALENRMEEDKTVPDGPEESSPRQSKSRSSSAESLPPPSPLHSIREDEAEEEEGDALPTPSTSESTEAVTEQSIPAVPVANVPTPPLTPKNDEPATRLDRADSVVTVTAERPKDSKDQPHDTDGTRDVSVPADPEISEPQQIRPETSEPRPAQPKPSSASMHEVGRPSSSHSVKITPDSRHSSFLIKFWNNLFGSWLAPVVRWFSRMCGGKGRAT
ncbi:hypothetical protein GTA08_BOTSDO00663 [Neofusicoccum parvum]|nr:hypothetical protein GTA08_BOTSDO00663 [Neofusicoccum parvum]